jgi:hypothetical protein
VGRNGTGWGKTGLGLEVVESCFEVDFFGGVKPEFQIPVKTPFRMSGCWARWEEVDWRS